MHATKAVPDPDTLVGLMPPQLRPFGTVSVKAVVEVNPFSAPIVIVLVLDWPALTVVGVAAVIVKSGWFIVKVAVAECTRDPLVPVNDSV